MKFITILLLLTLSNPLTADEMDFSNDSEEMIWREISAIAQNATERRKMYPSSKLDEGMLEVEKMELLMTELERRNVLVSEEFVIFPLKTAENGDRLFNLLGTYAEKMSKEYGSLTSRELLGYGFTKNSIFSHDENTDFKVRLPHREMKGFCDAIKEKKFGVKTMSNLCKFASFEKKTYKVSKLEKMDIDILSQEMLQYGAFLTMQMLGRGVNVDFEKFESGGLEEVEFCMPMKLHDLIEDQLGE